MKWSGDGGSLGEYKILVVRHGEEATWKIRWERITFDVKEVECKCELN